MFLFPYIPWFAIGCSVPFRFQAARYTQTRFGADILASWVKFKDSIWQHGWGVMTSNLHNTRAFELQFARDIPTGLNGWKTNNTLLETASRPRPVRGAMSCHPLEDLPCFIPRQPERENNIDWETVGTDHAEVYRGKNPIINRCDQYYICTTLRVRVVNLINICRRCRKCGNLNYTSMS